MTLEVHEGSGNVFADLDLPNPKERQAKAMIANYIEQLIDAAGWKQAEAAERMGLSQPDVSNIIRGRLSGFSLDRLMQCLVALDQKVEINVSPNASALAGVGMVLSL